VLSIKYGPTDYEETDVDVPRNAPILRMSLGNRDLIKPGANVLAGVRKATAGPRPALFLFVGDDGVVPPM
jgi:hypothetical protein